MKIAYVFTSKMATTFSDHTLINNCDESIQVNGPDGNNTLTDVEILRFNDVVVDASTFSII